MSKHRIAVALGLMVFGCALAYAWLRVALVFGMPEEDHDASVLKLGMIAGQIGPANVHELSAFNRRSTC
jgi:hypothetical protein